MTRRRRRRGEGTVRQLRSGRWQARIRGEDGRLRPGSPVTFDTKLDASAWLDAHSGGSAPQARAERRLGEYAADWLEHRDLQPRTRAHYRDLIDRCICPTLGTERLTRITAAVVRRWYEHLSDRSGATQRAHAYSLLRTIMNTAWQDDLIDANPCRIRGAAQTKAGTVGQAVEPDQVEALAAAMPPRYRAMVILTAYAALRFGEVTELRRADFDLDAGLVHVHRGVVRVGSAYIVGKPKTSAGRRTIAVPPTVVAMVADHLDTFVAQDDHALVFPATGDPDRHMAPSTLYKPFYRARAEVGLPTLRWHDLRHSGLTWAARTGATVADLMSRAGHTTAAVAMRYQHAASERDSAIAVGLDRMRSGQVIDLGVRRASSRR